MGPIDFVVILVIALIVGGASYYIYRAKKSGKKCIGCPHSASCKNSGGCSTSCSCGCSSNEEN